MSEEVDVVWVAQFSRERVLRVVISFDDVDRDAHLAQTFRLPNEKEARPGIRPVAIPEVTRYHDEG